MKNVLKLLAKIVLIPLVLRAAATAADAAIHKSYDDIDNFKWKNGRCHGSS